MIICRRCGATHDSALNPAFCRNCNNPLKIKGTAVHGTSETPTYYSTTPTYSSAPRSAYPPPPTPPHYSAPSHLSYPTPPPSYHGDARYSPAPGYVSTPTYISVPERPISSDTPAKPMAIISMVLGIIGLICAEIAILCSVDPYISLIGAFYAIFFSGAGIAALILASRAEENGNHTGFVTAGKVTGSIGIGINALAFMIGIINYSAYL